VSGAVMFSRGILIAYIAIYLTACIGRGQVTSFTETKLYAYMFALCLHYENFALDPSAISRDLGLGPSK
jgi:hypothetical protein